MMKDTIYYYYVHSYEGKEYYVPVPEITEAQQMENYSLYMTKTGVNDLIIRYGDDYVRLATEKVEGFYIKDGILKRA